MAHLLPSIRDEIGIVKDFLHGDNDYWKSKFIGALSDIDNEFNGDLMSPYILDKNDDDDDDEQYIDDNINSALQNMLRHVYEPFLMLRTDFKFKNIKLHNTLEHINNSSVLSDVDKQYVTHVIQNEIKTYPKYIFKCRVCQEYMNTQNPIMPLCSHTRSQGYEEE